MGTERLYYTDSGLLEFTASVSAVRETPDAIHIILDRTAFYPTGGGQPNDTGSINGAEIIDVAEDEAGCVIHIARPGANVPSQSMAGKTVECRVDAARRLDHMQQHSGQHILSQAFVQACGAETRSFHLGAATSTIDIELQNPTDEHMRAAEEIANRVVFEDRPMRVHIVSEAEAARLPLRKESAVHGEIRVIEIDRFDWSPCGGTHASRAGQIGLIAIKSFERAKRMTRVEFVCGSRVLVDYQLANKTATAVARQFSVDRESGPASVERLIQENKSLKKRVRELLEIALVEEAGRLLEGALLVAAADAAAGVPATGAAAGVPTNSTAAGLPTTDAAGAARAPFKLVKAVFPERDPEELRMLAWKIVERGQSAALLGTREGALAKLVFARSADLPFNMGALLASACEALGGRGGGKPDMAQGGGPNIEKLAAVIDESAKRILEGS
jgi:alanyl-tRNA synthetase